MSLPSPLPFLLTSPTRSTVSWEPWEEHQRGGKDRGKDPCSGRNAPALDFDAAAESMADESLQRPRGRSMAWPSLCLGNPTARQLLLLIRQDRLRHRDKRTRQGQTGRWAMGEIKANNIAQFESARVIRSSSASFLWISCRQR